MKKLRLEKMWLLAAIMLIGILVVACGPAQGPNNQDAAPVQGNEETDAQDATGSAATDEIVIDEPVVEAPAPAPVEEPAAPAAPPTPPPGAVVTDSGLQYLEEEAGNGDSPVAGDIVSLHFVGGVLGGSEFGNSYVQGTPITVIIGNEQLLPGWEEGLQLMAPGGKATLIVPPELGFGAEGAGGVIPPNATLSIEVELLSVSQPPVPTVADAGDYTTTDSGLRYVDLVAGEGDIPASGDTVTVDFTIWLQEDESFIVSSLTGGAEPFTFALGAGNLVFPGWDEGVSTMQVGANRQLIIPPDLALGEQGAPGVPPNSTLIMEVVLLSVRPAPKITEVDEEDYIVTDSGLKYYDLVEGDGATPELGQSVEVHYTGWLTDGTVFDSSVERGQTFSFVLGTGGVIAGWDEGVASMQVGTKRQLVIPAELAYGPAGSGIIPPDATLIFEVELISVP